MYVYVITRTRIYMHLKRVKYDANIQRKSGLSGKRKYVIICTMLHFIKNFFLYKPHFYTK
jgi:hypothetical protein